MKYLSNFLRMLLASICYRGALSQPISLLECPKTSGVELVLVPDPLDCSRFYICGPNGQSIHMNCPTGLYFNPNIDVCDYPDNVDCIPSTETSSTITSNTPNYNVTTTSNIPNYNTTTTPIPNYNITTTPSSHNNITTADPHNNITVITTASPALNLSTDQLFNDTTDSIPPTVFVESRRILGSPECPANSGSSLILLPDPYDCGSYYMCTSQGSPIHMQCPADLFFNPVLKVCDYPRFVDCIPMNFTTSPSPLQNITTPENSTYQPSNSTSTTYAPGNATFVPISNTTSVAPDFTTTLPPSNTTNVISETSTASVISENGTTTASPIINTTAPANITTSPNYPSNITGSPNFVVTAPPSIASQCPTFSPSVPPTHLPNPEDCSSFYTCVADNIAFLQYCQPGLLFNEYLKMCDFPHNVDC